jgi:hypothetical protein
VPVGALGVSPAGALSGLSCTIPLARATVAPGLSNVPTANKITLKLPLKACKGTPGITNGTLKGTIVPSTKLTCASVANAGTGKITATIKWNNAKTSTWSGSATAKVVSGKVTSVIAGAVTSGLFAKQLVSTTVAVSLDPTGGSCTTEMPMKSLIVKGTKPFVIR